MFTFVRILTNNIVHCTSAKHVSPDNDIEPPVDAPLANPWKKELDRLARCQCQNAGLPTYRKAPSMPRPEPQSQPGKLGGNGSLTDQKVWWGKALAHYTLPPGGSPANHPCPPKTIKRWQQ